MMTVIIPRGLTAAILGSLLFQQGISGGETVQNLAYAVVLSSIALTSLLIVLIDKTSFYKMYNVIFSNMKKNDHNEIV